MHSRMRKICFRPLLHESLLLSMYPEYINNYMRISVIKFNTIHR